MVTPKPGPDETLTIPPSAFNEEVSLLTGMSALPSYPVNGAGFGIAEAKIAASRSHPTRFRRDHASGSFQGSP
jgi:hypothetical protein